MKKPLILWWLIFFSVSFLNLTLATGIQSGENLDLNLYISWEQAEIVTGDELIATSWYQDEFTQMLATADELGIGHCELNGNPIPCKELYSKVNVFLTQMPVVGWMFNSFDGLLTVWLWFLWISLLVSLLWFIFWLWMLIDVLSYEKENPVLRALVIVFWSILGAIIYFFVVKRRRGTDEAHSLS